MDIEIIKNRKWAQKATDIPAEVLSLLNAGRIETVNLTEWLAVDHSQLVKSVFPALGIDKISLKSWFAKSIRKRNLLQ